MKQKKIVVVGLGQTGLSCVQFLRNKGFEVSVTDSRDLPPNLERLQQEYPEVITYTGEISDTALAEADEIVLSPGVWLQEPTIAKYVKQGKPVVGDVELFLREVQVPVIAITGSNGKTTVTTLVGEMCRHAGLKTAVCGNIGIPVLDMLADKDVEIFVLELSSFQLETTYSLHAKAATVLNICPDHMDRYNSFEDYVHAKQHIYDGCQIAVLNADAPEIWSSLKLPEKRYYFSLQSGGENTFHLLDEHGEAHLAFEDEVLLPCKELPLQGLHQWQNALSALALGAAAKLPMDSMLAALRQFTGLTHRCQPVVSHQEVLWINDSKGTNVGASVAAINSFGKICQGKLILIAGGDAKQADLSLLRDVVVDHVGHVILIGRDAPRFVEIFDNVVPVTRAADLAAAVDFAASIAESGDIVLLSPACASFDMFKNYEHRGDVFMNLVRSLAV